MACKVHVTVVVDINVVDSLIPLVMELLKGLRRNIDRMPLRTHLLDLPLRGPSLYSDLQISSS
jgi:hypothetical protein